MKKTYAATGAAFAFIFAMLSGIATTVSAATAVGDQFQHVINIDQCIPRAEHAAIREQTSTYNAKTCFDAAIDACPTAGCKIEFGPGKYEFASAIHLKKVVWLEGQGRGVNLDQGTILRFPTNTHGIVVHSHNTDNSGTVASGARADGSIISNLVILSGAAGSSGYGIWLRARAIIRNVLVRRFNIGVNIVAGMGAGGFLEGNVNNWYMDNVRVQDSTSHGVFVDGADSNAGVGIMIDATANGGWGIYDLSFLGNTWIQGHTATNTSGGYKTDNANQRAVFVGCYDEGDQPAASVIFPSIIIGGLWGGGFTAGSDGLRLIDGSITPFTVNGTAADTVYGASGPKIVGRTDHAEGYRIFDYDTSSGMYWLKWANLNTGLILSGSSSSTLTGGRGAALAGGNLWFPAGLWLGTGSLSGSTPRQLTYADTMPASGSYARGDFVFNSAPTLDANNITVLGWHRLTTGSNHVSGTDWAIIGGTHVSPAN